MKNITLISIIFFFIINCNAQNTGNVATVTEGNSRFAFDLYGQLNEDKNIFFSPFSISAALSMTYAGAANKTSKEMQEVLYFKENNIEFHKEFSNIIKKIQHEAKDENSPQITIANCLYAQKDYSFKEDFVKIITKYYKAPFVEVDFKNDKNREKARKEINAWVEKTTNKKIVDLLPPSSLTNATRLILVNALYFKASWRTPFNENKTYQDDFWIDEKTPVKTDFMRGIYESAYFENDLLQIVTLPYKNNIASLIIFLPKDKDNFASFQKEFTYENYMSWMSQTVSKKIGFTIPKFKIEDTYEMKNIFMKMGMKKAFSKKADFTGMTEKSELRISKIMHKAFIEIDEKGTEAAAATAVVMERKSGKPKMPATFKADHPFIFMIRDNSTKAILFIGHIKKIKN